MPSIRAPASKQTATLLVGLSTVKAYPPFFAVYKSDLAFILGGGQMQAIDRGRMPAEPSYYSSN